MVINFLMPYLILESPGKTFGHEGGGVLGGHCFGGLL